jgi:serine/threonine protein kinase/Tol biopolymer transport system component
MRLRAGDQLGPYEILATIGAGGMGEVYRGRDARLDRQVAIKVLPAALAADPERLARFEREARTLAALNHPNVAQIYGTERVASRSAAGAEGDAINALAMEFVEGHDLSARIAQGPMPVEDALDVASQVALALEAAHEFGIVHRDLKPSNIRVREDGTVKVLDFGLAKALAPPTSMLSGGTSPTITTPAMTQQGMILGTAAYMAPEQARGKPADKRADIWAFGVILYEMTTGRRPFDGETVSEALASVLKSDPDWQPVPPELRRLLRSCLEKDPKKRLRDIGDWRRQLDDADATSAATTPRKPWLAWSVAGVFAVAAGVLGVIHLQEAAPVPLSTSFSIPAPAKTIFGPGFAASPDGRAIVFSARGSDNVLRAWIREADALEPRPLAGTEGARAPSWSPDGRSIAFVAGNILKRVAVDGGPALTIHEGPNATAMGGAAWSPAGVLVFGGFRGGAIRSVPEAGGPATALTSLDPSRREVVHGIPSLLPDGRHFLYVRVSVLEEHSGIFIGSIDRKPAEQDLTRLLPATQATFVRASNGADYLLYLQKGTLVAHPFDAVRLRVFGERVPVVEGVGSAGAAGLFTAGGGTIAYRSGAQTTGTRETQLTWLDRKGAPTGVAGRPSGFDSVIRLSPSADWVAVMLVETPAAGLNVDIWVVELARGVPQRLTSDIGPERWPLWSPDGERLIYASTKGLFVMPSRSGTPTPLLDGAGRLPTSWSQDGKYVLFTRTEPGAQPDIWLLPMAGERKPVPLIHTQYSESQGQFSPDGRWIAYVSNATGRPEVYIAPFSPQDLSVDNGKQYSIEGGETPRWGRNGKEVIFETPGDVIVAVDLTADPKAQPGTPGTLFPLSPGAAWDVTSDGQRFLVTMPSADAGLMPINVLLHWRPDQRK